MTLPLTATLAFALAAAAVAPPSAAQDTFERTPGMSGGWVGVPWLLYVDLPHRFRDVRRGDGFDLGHVATFTGVLGLPARSAASLSVVPGSPVAPRESDELELLLRHQLLADPAAFGDVSLAAAWNAAATSFDIEAGVARWFGRLRLLGAARWSSDARGAGHDRLAFGGGIVWQPLAGRAPVALAGDVAYPTDLADDEEPSWSAGLQLGVPHTSITISLQATNAASATLQGSTFATGRTRWGFELILPIPAGYFLGRYPARRVARDNVTPAGGSPAQAVVQITRYAYTPRRIEVSAGSVIEWRNGDQVVHTATAADGAWDSEGIQPGSSWRARFERPGTYPYYCAPHPFMLGVVIVR